MPRKFDWTLELIERTRQLYWDRQKSASEVIAILQLPLTPQAITQMFHRLHIPVRDWHESLYLRPKKVMTEEQKHKISIALKGKPLTRQNWHPTEEHKARLRLYHHTKEAKQKLSRISKAMWQDPDHKERHLRALRRASAQRPTKPEQKVLDAITTCDLPYIYNGASCDLIIQGRCPDFINVNGKKAIIEVFGDYWHRITKDYWQTEQGRKELFEPLGFKLLILWEKHIKEVSVETLAKEIEVFTNSC